MRVGLAAQPIQYDFKAFPSPSHPYASAYPLFDQLLCHSVFGQRAQEIREMLESPWLDLAMPIGQQLFHEDTSASHRYHSPAEWAKISPMPDELVRCTAPCTAEEITRRTFECPWGNHSIMVPTASQLHCASIRQPFQYYGSPPRPLLDCFMFCPEPRSWETYEHMPS